MPNLEAVIKELQAERDRLDKAIAILTSLDGNAPARVKSPIRPRRHISPAGLQRIRAAAKARWAKIREAKKK